MVAVNGIALNLQDASIKYNIIADNGDYLAITDCYIYVNWI